MDGLLADASDLIYLKKFSPSKAKYNLWLSFFGNYSHVKKDQNFSAITDWMGGALIGFDYYGIEDSSIGAGIAYAYDHAKIADNVGTTTTNQELLTIYYSKIFNNFFMNVALWTGPYQKRNIRNTLTNITSVANYDGWLLLPHLEISFPIYAKENRFIIDPFAMFDWANNFQSKIEEVGAAGLNLLIKRQYTSNLRSETGLRFFEYLKYSLGIVLLKEKASWINLKPFNAGLVKTSFVGASSSFEIELFRNKTQNLAALSFFAKFIPNNFKYPYGSINYQAEVGSSSLSHTITLEIGKYF